MLQSEPVLTPLLMWDAHSRNRQTRRITEDRHDLAVKIWTEGCPRESLVLWITPIMRAAVGKWQKEEVRDGLAAGVGVEEQRARDEKDAQTLDQ